MDFVTGGTGLLGAHVLFDLLKNGRSVRALKRSNSKTGFLKDLAPFYGVSEGQLNSVEWVDADLLHPLELEKAMLGCTHVYHCAAFVSFDPRDREKLFEVNIVGTANMVNAALSAEIKKFCFVSSTAAVGKSKFEEVVTEEASWSNNDKHSNYGISKHYAEREVWRGMEEGLNVVIVNPCIIVGPGQWGKSSTDLFNKVWNGFKFYATGSNAFVDVRDVSRIMLQLMHSDIQGERFLLIGENRTFKSFFDEVAKALGKPAPTVKVSPFLTGLAWRLAWIQARLTGTRPFITQETARNAQSKVEYSNDKIKQALDVNFTPLRQSVEHAASVFLKQH